MPKKLTYEYVKSQIEKEGYVLLSNSYKNVRIKLKVKCPNDHEYIVTYNDFQSGNRCPLCAKNQKLTYDFVKEQIEKERYLLLSDEYRNSKSKLNMKCPIGHIFKMGFGSFKQGQRCSVCHGTPKHLYSYIKEQIEKEGYKLLSKEYEGNKTHLQIQCKDNHIYKMRWDCFQRGQRCPECDRNKKASKAEKYVFEYTKTLYNGEIIPNDRTQIINPETGYGLELDIWLPELKKAIEFNGVYWHSLPDIKKKDKIKYQQCVEKGIDLMVINEEIWIANKEQCLNKIQEFIGL